MPAMPPNSPMPPAEFVASATKKGFVFSVKPGGSLGVKPPTPGSLTAPMRRYVIAMKPELLALLIPPVVDKGSEAKAPTEPTEAPETPVKAPSLNYVKTKSRESESQVKAKFIGGELDQVGSESASELGEVGRESPSTALYSDHRQEVLCWAVSEAKKGTLPELAEPLLLPSGQVVQADGAAVWLIAAESRSVGLRSHAAASPDCALALCVVQRDMEALARWAARASVWLDAPYTAPGGLVRLLPGAV